jgi:hypothetical protein
MEKKKKAREERISKRNDRFIALPLPPLAAAARC